MLSLQFPEYHITGTTLTEECVSWRLDASPILDAEGFGEDGECDPFSLSRGELKRLHLACVLGKQHNLLLLDEPFSALDCEQKERLSRRLSERTTGITIIFTHERGILPRIDRYWEIRDGHLLDLGTFCPDFFRIEYPEQKRKNPER